ncbi:Sucrase/ferredoxin-like family protein [Perilla frutescens var. hirtella]|uniref:Sucrase/ferredoxin-like family protein n=1 Tax=Perilla frutescens var. hirtella TaxID=608512 RepID=A0AAD4J6N9_PERFH|nr:Sucrase/ferredoxin-like family protein [Perilla frutescens var. hirtella]
MVLRRLFFSVKRVHVRQGPLVGTVELYDRHVFLCYKNPQVWPPRIEAAEFDCLPRLLTTALAARNPHMQRQAWGTLLCKGVRLSKNNSMAMIVKEGKEPVELEHLHHLSLNKDIDDVANHIEYSLTWFAVIYYGLPCLKHASLCRGSKRAAELKSYGPPQTAAEAAKQMLDKTV